MYQESKVGFIMLQELPELDVSKLPVDQQTKELLGQLLNHIEILIAEIKTALGKPTAQRRDS
jgi:hypothetical protein